ncbi:T9SS type A sorting domain-containing protein [Pontibacter burrus]|uniref:T9SS type A sorting domain-containing protein n=1 Tax=Pontibacter burrus TaxID=2704466 RepID=A0A6B3LV53_9BACT|nr:T9SS type A sorting domain-containing protein [Pontibacter burrus]NEM97364.1 T9SS type A sorting domain-containing protein [Pontibacter burrus]
MKTLITATLWMLFLSIQCFAQPEPKKNAPPLEHNPKAVGYIQSFTLIDPDTDSDIRTLAQNDVINAGTPINIRVNTEGKVRSMLITISNGDTRIDNDEPYSVAGDQNGDYRAWLPEPGVYTISATPYNNTRARGKEGTTVTMQLTVLPVSPPNITFTLINAETNQDLMVLTDMTELNLAQVRGIKLNIRADVDWNLTESVTMDLTGIVPASRTDNDAPYTLLAEDADGWAPTEGIYTLMATAYSQDNADGRAGATKTISFTVNRDEGEPNYAYRDYVELNNLMVVYTNTNGGTLPANYADVLAKALEELNMFYWRHSHMTLNLNWTVLVIDEYLERVHENGYVYPHEVDADLRSRNFPVDTYDAVGAFVVGGGAYAWGVNQVLGKGAYFQVPWWEEHYQLSAFLMHEFNHVVDAMFHNAGLPEYPSNHPGSARVFGEFIPNSSHSWDLNAQIIQHWDKNQWYELFYKGNWGSILQAVDNEQDGFPDNEPNVPFDEARFGSSPTTADTDGDGLPDLEEAMAGIFLTLNPLSADSDGDGIPDAQDTEPLYPINATIPFTENFPLTEDITDWPLAGTYFFQREVSGDASFYLAYSSERLFIGAKLPTAWHEIRIIIDANNDGVFYGSDNIEIVFDRDLVQELNLLDVNAVPVGSHEDYIRIPDITYNYATTVRHEVGWSSFQFALNRLSQYGLDLQPGEQIGISVHVIGYGFMLEHDDLMTFTFGDQDPFTASTSELLKKQASKAFVYPNPASSQISFVADANEATGTWRIVDSRGREVQRSKIRTSGPETINIKSLPTGLYILQIESAAGKKSYKFIKN